MVAIPFSAGRGAAIVSERWPGTGSKLEIEGALEEPNARDEHHQRRPAAEHEPAVQPAAAQQISDRQKASDDGELSDLDAEVESHQREQQALLGKAEVG